MLEGLPIRGGGKLDFDIEDPQGGTLKGELYLNKDYGS